MLQKCVDEQNWNLNVRPKEGVQSSADWRRPSCRQTFLQEAQIMRGERKRFRRSPGHTFAPIR